MKTIIKCKNCGKEYLETTSNCCWINCSCGKTICGQCGYAKEKWKYCPVNSEDDNYWCKRVCPKCGLQGCGKCI